MKWWRVVTLAVVVCLLLAVTTAASADTTYVVQRGDTLSAIARQFGTTVTAIAQANNIVNPNLIYTGQVLTIPGTSGGSTPPPPPSGGGGTTYTVRPGDTLSRIAVSFGVTVQAIAQANGISNVNLIYVGQVLTIPGASGGGGGAPPPPPAPSGDFELGGQTHSLGRPDLMNRAGMVWVKFQHKWSPGDDPGAIAGRVRDGHSQGYKVLISVTGAQTYPAAGSINFTSFVNFLGSVAALGPDAPDAIEIWNEMNIDFEWPAGEISPSSYVNNMLKPAYSAIKAANGNILVISGALAPTGFDNGTNAWADNRYVSGMAAAGAGSYMDCVGAHHNAGATSPYSSTGHPAGSHYSWYFAATQDVYYNAFGGARKVCFTELGYLSSEGFAGLPANFSWAANTSLAEHAQWLAEAVTITRSNGKVRLLIIYNVDFTHYDLGGDPQAGYAMLRPDGTCPACDSLNGVMGGR